MLYLNPPFFVINGVSIFPDHVDPAQFYFLPMAPHLTITKDPTTNENVPSIELIMYRGDKASGGFLDFDVNLGLTVDLDELASSLRQAAKLDVTPRLAPVPIVDGTVKLMMLGAQTPDPTPPKPGSPAQPSNGFVIKMESASKPSLYGDEQATFSVQLDAQGATIVQDALTGNISPIGIVYSLDFLALRPAYNIKVTIDWDRVQHHLDESFSVNVTFFSSQIDKVIDELVESQAIRLEATTEVDEADPNNKDLLARRDQALAEARDMIKSTFFQSSIPPPTAGQPDDIDKASRVADKFSQLAVSGGLSSFASFGYRKVDMTRIDHKQLNSTFDERTTVRKTIYPQGHLQGLFSAAKGGTALDKVVKQINIDDPYFKSRSIDVISRADFAHDGIQSIDVRVEYGGTPQNVLIDSTTEKGRGNVHWLSQLDGSGAMVRNASYSYKVTFKDADRSERPVTLDTAVLGLTLSTTEDIVEIVPRELLYSISDVPIAALPEFPWDRYPQVDVAVRYTDEANQVHQERTYRLTQTAATGSFQMFMRDPTKRTFEAKVTYHGSDGTDYSPGWTEGADEQVIVRDPFPRLVQLTVVPQVDWTTTDRVFVDVDYEPDDVQQSFEFNAKDSGSKTFSCHPKDPTQKLVEYQVTILTKAGAEVKVPKSYTSERRLIVRPDMRGHRVVGVTSDGKPFGDAHVVGIDVDIRYIDNDHGLSFSDRFTFKSTSDHAAFEFDYVDEAKTSYEYKTTTRYDNGLSSATDWTSANDGVLAVPVG